MARFDFIARFYDRHNAYAHAQALGTNLALAGDETVLDVGGGTGQVGQAVQGRWRRWIVVDPSGGMRHEARTKPGIEVVAGLGESLPVREASVDRVVIVDALHHAHDQDGVLRQAFRVLKPGGVAVVEEFRWDRWRVKLAIGVPERIMRFGSRFDRPESWRRRMEAAGFRVRAEPISWREVQLVGTKPRNL